MKPKSLFVCPTSEGINALPLPPLGMLWVASYLRENGYSVDAIDTYVDSDKQLLAEKIKNSDLVCISGTSSHQFESAKHIARVAKDLGKKTVFGGIHATVLPDDSSQHFDLVVRGEGEETMLDIVKSFPHILTDIPGTSYLDGSSVHHNSSRPLIRNIDSLPLPARDLIPPTRYPHRELKRFPGRYTSILGGRGCSDKCIFCGSPKMWDRPRLRSAESLFEEMTQLYERWGIKNIHFHDDTFTMSKKRANTLCNLIREGDVDFKWSCMTRPDRVDLETLLNMKDAGCVQIEIGAESADPEILKTARKRYAPEQVREAFSLAKKAGIPSYAYFIIGLPGETLGTYLKTIRFARSLDMDSSVWTVLSPFPGTEVYEKKMVEVLKPDCWLYKEPVIRSGWMGPRTLSVMRSFADLLVNGPGYHGAYVEKQKF